MTSSLLLLCLLGGLDGGVEAAAEVELSAPDAGVDFRVTPVVAPACGPELSFFIVAGVASWNGSGYAFYFQFLEAF